jgi:plastocyanin
MNTTTASSSMTNDTGIATDSATAVRVAVGGGNVTVQHYTFEPQMVEIDAGESVTW